MLIVSVMYCNVIEYLSQSMKRYQVLVVELKHLLHM